MGRKQKIHRSKDGQFEYWWIAPHDGFPGRWYAQWLYDGTQRSFDTLPELLNWITA